MPPSPGKRCGVSPCRARLRCAGERQRSPAGLGAWPCPCTRLGTQRCPPDPARRPEVPLSSCPRPGPAVPRVPGGLRDFQSGQGGHRALGSGWERGVGQDSGQDAGTAGAAVAVETRVTGARVPRGSARGQDSAGTAAGHRPAGLGTQRWPRAQRGRACHSPAGAGSGLVPHTGLPAPCFDPSRRSGRDFGLFKSKCFLS